MQNFVPNAAIATFHNKDILVCGVYDNFAAVSGAAGFAAAPK